MVIVDRTVFDNSPRTVVGQQIAAKGGEIGMVFKGRYAPSAPQAASRAVSRNAATKRLVGGASSLDAKYEKKKDRGKRSQQKYLIMVGRMSCPAVGARLSGSRRSVSMAGPSRTFFPHPPPNQRLRRSVSMVGPSSPRSAGLRGLPASDRDVEDLEMDRPGRNVHIHPVTFLCPNEAFAIRVSDRQFSFTQVRLVLTATIV